MPPGKASGVVAAVIIRRSRDRARDDSPWFLEHRDWSFSDRPEEFLAAHLNEARLNSEISMLLRVAT